MTPENMALLRTSFARIKPIAPFATVLFYDRLFKLDPSLKRLFKGDMAAQGRRLIAMIGTAVASLDNLDAVLPTVRQLGRRHAAYGVQPADYDTFAAAFLATLERGLGDKFTPAMESAWTEAYTTLATVMKDAAAE